MEETTNGILVNHPNRLESSNYEGSDGFIVYGDQYTDNIAVGCNIPNGVVFDTGILDKKTFEGYYNVRVFFDATNPNDKGIIPGLVLEIYEDEELKVWNTGDSVDGSINLDLAGTSQKLGARIVMWFDPNKTYRIVLRTPLSLAYDSINVDYVQLTQIHHANPLMSWINGSEIVGGDLWMIDTNSDSVTGSGTTAATKTVNFAYNFKEVYMANAICTNASTLNVSLSGNPTANGATFSFKHIDGSNWTSTINFKWWVLGTVELPMIRPL